MAWAKVDDNLAFHPKVLAAGNEAMGLWVRSLSWGMQQLTDGFIPIAMIVAFNGQHVADALVAHGLWHEVDGGYQFNDWCEYQPTKEKVLEERSKTAERQAKWRGSNGKSNGVSNSVSNGVTNSAPTRPDPTPSISKEIERRATRLPLNFEITKEMADWFEKGKFALDIELETENFRDYWKAKVGKDAIKLDWVATWRSWIRRSQSFLPEKATMDPWAGKEHLGFAE